MRRSGTEDCLLAKDTTFHRPRVALHFAVLGTHSPHAVACCLLLFIAATGSSGSATTVRPSVAVIGNFALLERDCSEHGVWFWRRTMRSRNYLFNGPWMAVYEQSNEGLLSFFAHRNFDTLDSCTKNASFFSSARDLKSSEDPLRGCICNYSSKKQEGKQATTTITCVRQMIREQIQGGTVKTTSSKSPSPLEMLRSTE